MIKIPIKLQPYKKGDRVIIDVGENLYELATITSVRKGVWHIRFDDGNEGEADDIRDIAGYAVSTPYKHAFTRKDLPKYLVKDHKQKGNAWAISDIHGCYAQLQQLLAKIKFTPNDILYINGDLVDRGPASKAVLDFAMTTTNVITLRGNHEDMLLQAFSSPSQRIQDWYEGNGGGTTLDSLGVTEAKDVPKKYIAFLQKLPIVQIYKNFIIGHAGVDLNSNKDPLRSTDTNYNYVLWNREVQADGQGKRRIVVGHTPMSLTDIKKGATSNKIMIDGGCAYGGSLVAFCLDDNRIESVKGLKS